MLLVPSKSYDFGVQSFEFDSGVCGCGGREFDALREDGRGVAAS